MPPTSATRPATTILSVWTTQYSIDFFEKMGHYARIGGLEIARAGDETWMEEVKRKVLRQGLRNARELYRSGRGERKVPAGRGRDGGRARCGIRMPALSSRARRPLPASSSTGEKTGKLKVFANTPAQSLIVENGRIKGVVTHRGTIMADHVVVCAGLWGRQIAEMVGEDLPVMPVDHPLTFFGPYREFEGTGKDIGFPLLRDQGNSAYMRDTGDPKTPKAGRSSGATTRPNPRLCHPRDILEKERSPPVALAARPRHGAGHRAAGTRHGTDAHPGELGYNESHSFNGLLQVTPPAARPAAKARRCAGCGTASPSGSRTARATAS
jgi:glycine/D-amino acid oxidase-like deaminating enzyme